ncbi:MULTISPECIES: ABC transporter substrate-binding protein [unclassified Meiothermus]|uniref:ABC transporter substrate-binding protein n=1 Tax=unclassified Meiothermus TaxID=370471 RepID=UPI000D7C4869|nr:MULTISPECIES: ABC transporter substrate-binding protein [unclassified Meiothermus]PZA06752.1 ABC transporter substrate-binding protein [Meiothermus sp. Pnk-1]RYM37661.1 ABC transporter substrate-binding protein [Meiothermus sp. PNK-Is4]
MTIRKALWLLGCMAMGLAMAQPKVVSGYENGKPGGTLTMALASAPQTMFYYGAIDSAIQTLANQMFDGLIEYNYKTYQIEPALAASWTITGESKVYTFKLRKGVKWSDGRDLTADDVVFTYTQIVANPEAKGGDAGNFAGVKIEKVDASTVRFTLPKPAPAFIHYMRLPIMPKHKLLPFSQEGGKKPGDINNAWPTTVDPNEVVGTGPFKLQSYTPGQKVTLVKNPNYWKRDADGTPLPYLDRLEFLIIPDSQARVAQFLAGNLGQLNITGSDFPSLKQREVQGAPIKVVQFRALFGSPPHLAFNYDDKNPELAALFRKTEFRRAIQSAVNRKRIIDDVYNGLAELPGNGVAPVSEWYYDTTKLLGTYDLAAANAALDKLGLKKGPDGIRLLPSGKPLEFTLTYGSNSSTFTAIATIIQNDLKAIGVKANLQGVLAANLLSTGRGKDWDAILLGFGDQPDPELRTPIWKPGGDLYYWHQSTQPITPGGQPQFSNFLPWEKEVYDLWEKAASTTNFTQRKALYDRWQAIFAREAMVIMIAKEFAVGAVSNRYGNYIYSLGVIPGYNPVPIMYQK